MSREAEKRASLLLRMPYQMFYHVSSSRRDELEPAIHAASGLRRDVQDFDAGAYSLQVLDGGRTIEFHCGGKVGLGDHGDVGAVDDGWVLERLVFALGNRQQHNAQMFTQIV